MKIKLTSIYVDNQDRALAFYTESSAFRRRQTTPPESSSDRRLTRGSGWNRTFLAPTVNPAATALQQSLKERGEHAAVFHTTDLQGEYERLVRLGVTFTLPPSKEGWGSMAMLDDNCGNLIQLTQPAW